MGSAPSDGPGPSDGSGDIPLAPFKILIAGGFGAGKTTLVGAISEVRPLRTEEALTRASVGTDDLTGVGRKTTTTVAMDFGRLTMGTHLVLYLFGTPGQERFWFMWDELSFGALGAVVVADTRRLGDSFPSVDYFERRGLPFIVAINCFDGAPRYDPEDVRIALDLGPRVPAIFCDARKRDSVKQVLITLVEHVLASKVKNGWGSAPDPADPAASYPSGPGGAPHPVAGSRAGVTAQAPPPQPS
jgi:signal recognition particle receptor subunit beta